MGTWSAEPFGNDDACDWACGLINERDFSLIERTLDKVLNETKYLDASDGAEAVAAVEVLAKAGGKGTQTDSYTESVDKWITSSGIEPPGAALLEKAQRALARLLADDSELKNLWEESDGRPWYDSIQSLQRSISSRASPRLRGS